MTKYTTIQIYKDMNYQKKLQFSKLIQNKFKLFIIGLVFKKNT